MMNSQLFPSGFELKELLNLAVPAEIDDLVARSLTEPLKDLFSRPRKDIRSELVRLGFLVAARKQTSSLDFNFMEVLPEACEILEILHAGSLIIDDIEDGTSVRRGQKALHLRYGLPVALNAGNWLYFLPFQRIEKLNLPESHRIRISRECQKTLLLAHYGQALDVGISVDTVEKERVPEISLAAMELKSGVLTGFAMKLGALAAGCDEKWVSILESLGRRLGVALQMFDDIGNLSSTVNPEKRGEDLRLRRPCFAFSVAAETLAAEDYQQFIRCLSENEDPAVPISFLKLFEVDRKGIQKAQKHLDEICFYFGNALNLQIQEKEILQTITSKMVKSYV